MRLGPPYNREKKGLARAPITPRKKGAARAPLNPQKKGASRTPLNQRKRGAAWAPLNSPMEGAVRVLLNPRKKGATRKKTKNGGERTETVKIPDKSKLVASWWSWLVLKHCHCRYDSSRSSPTHISFIS